MTDKSKLISDLLVNKGGENSVKKILRMDEKTMMHH